MKPCVFVGSTTLLFLSILPVFATDGTIEGEISISGLVLEERGSEAKFNEYRDLTDGIYGGAWASYDSEEYFFKGLAADIGSDTQRYEVEGGRFGSFKASLGYQEIPQNFTYGAKTFYSGVGTNNLTFTPPIPPVASWQDFDYSTKRESFEGKFSLDQFKPFFFEMSIPHEKKTGIIPIGAANGPLLFPGFQMVELPGTLDHTTNSINLTSGYAQNPFFAAVSLYYSEFDNDNSAQFFNRSTFLPVEPRSVGDAYSQPPDNEVLQAAFKGSVKLPYNSQVSVNLANGSLKSDGNVLLTSKNFAGPPGNLFGPTFDGNVDTNNYDVVLITNPVQLLKAKIDYKYYNRENDSDQLTTTDPFINASATNRLRGFQTNRFGMDLDWSLPSRLNLGTSYANLQTSRDFRVDLPETDDNIYGLELKWRRFNLLIPKVRYERLERSATHGTFSNTDAEAYIWRFDAAPKVQDTIKASVEFNPLSNLDFTFGFKHVEADYPDTILGLQSSQSNQMNLNTGYTLGTIAQLNAYFDMELTKDFQFQRSFFNTPNPSIQTPVEYNWTADLKDKSYAWGTGAEIYLISDNKLTLLLQYDNIHSNGNVDYTYLFTPVLTANRLDNDVLDIANWDDYRQTYSSVRLRYVPNKQYTYMVGYAYERYRYEDAQFDNYLMVQGQNYLTGAYADPDYDAHIIFLSATYRF
jgi:MtrB/PioB family decaheme-associated outer membrane protein